MGVLNLPEPSTATLARAPLEQVIWQVRHELRALEVPTVIKVRDALQESYPTIEQASVTEITVVGPGGQSSGNEARIGWRLRSDDQLWTLVLMPDFFAVECTGYTTWTNFRARAENFAEAVVEFVQPALVQRIGLRYVDRLVRRGTGRPGQWRGLVDPAILSFADDDVVFDEVQVVQTLNQIQTNEGLAATLRTSCAPDSVASGYSMLIDTDCYDGRSRAFDLGSIRDTTNALHVINLKLFQRCLRAEYLNELASDD